MFSQQRPKVLRIVERIEGDTSKVLRIVNGFRFCPSTLFGGPSKPKLESVHYTQYFRGVNLDPSTIRGTLGRFGEEIS